MTDKEIESKSLTPNKAGPEFLEVQGKVNTVAKLMRPSLPKMSEMAGTFEKIKRMKEMIAQRQQEESNSELSSGGIEGDENQDTANTVTITVNHTLHGDIMTLDESDSDDSNSGDDVINDVALSKTATSSHDSDVILSDSDDDENEDDISIVAPSCQKLEDKEDHDISILSSSSSEELQTSQKDSDDDPIFLPSKSAKNSNKRPLITVLLPDSDGESDVATEEKRLKSD